MSDGIKVVVKVRPLVKREIEEGLNALWSTDRDRIWPTQCTKDSYTFDAVFGETCSTEDVYTEVARPIVEAAMNGINGTIFAYGQTSSGKTYTMMGSSTSPPGIIPLAVNHIFQSMEQSSDRTFLLRVSFLEIYNEKIRDLLDIKNTAELKIVEKDGCFQVLNCREVVTPSPEDVISTFEKGNVNRSVGETLMNDRSSRSHTIFKIIIESRKHTTPDGFVDDCVIFSHLNLVDLAGSERASQTGATKERLREGGHINKSLVTLSRVIRELSNVQGDTDRYINYRDSKLTYMLQSSLGGNAKTGIICAVTPATLEETHSTLKFAMCAKVIANKPIVNAIVSDARQRKLLQEKLDELQKELDTKKLVEEDNARLQEKIAVLNARMAIGFGKQANVTVSNNNKYRRRTWCAELKPISENDDDPIALNEKNKFDKSHKFSVINRLSGLREQSFETNKPPVVIEETNDLSLKKSIITSFDSPEKKYTLSVNDCSPNHRCYQMTKTPPCILRERAKHAQKELDELEELTTLEKMYKPEEVELVKQYNVLRETYSSSIEDNKKSITNYEDKIRELNKKLESQTETENQIKKFKAQVISLTQTNTDLEFELNNVKNKKEAREKELLILLEETRHDNKKYMGPNDIFNINSTRNSNVPITNLNDKSMSDNQILTEKDLDLFTKIEKYFEIEEQNKLLTQDVESLNLELKHKMELIDVLEKSSVQYERNYHDQISIISDLKLEVDSLRNSSMLCNEKLISVQNENLKIPDLVAEIELLKEKLKLNSGLNNTSSKLIEFEKDRYNDADTIDLDISIQKQSNEISRLKDMILELNNIKDTLKCDNERLLKYNSERESSMATLKDILQSQENKIHELLCENKRMSDVISEIRPDRIQALEADNSNLNKLLCESRKENERNLMSIQELNQTVSEKSMKILNLTCEIDEIKPAMETMESLKCTNQQLMVEREQLKADVEYAWIEMGELTADIDKLHKKILNQYRNQQVMQAEYSLLYSQLAAFEHYHVSVHGSCESTLADFKCKLILLRSALQNDDMSDSSLFTSMLINQESIIENDTVNASIVVHDIDNSTANIINKSSVDKEETKKKIDVESQTLNKENEHMKTNLQMKDAEISSLKHQIESLQSQINNLQTENEDLSNQLMEYVQELEGNQHKTDNASMANIKEVTHAGMNTSSPDQQSSNNVSINCDILKSEVITQNVEYINRINTLQSEIFTNNDVILDLQNKMSETTEELKNVLTAKSQCEQEFVSKIKSLENQISLFDCKENQLVEDLATLKSEKSSLKADVQDLIHKNDVLNNKVKELEEKCDVLMKTEIELKDTLETKRKEVEKSVNSFEDLQNSIQNTNLNNVELKQQLLENQNSLLELRNRVVILEEEIKVKEDELRCQKIDLESNSEKYAKLSDAFNSINSEKLTWEIKENEMGSELENLKEKLLESNNEKLNMLNNKTNLKEEVNKLNSIIAEKEIKIEDLTSEIQVNVATLQEQIKSLKTDIVNKNELLKQNEKASKDRDMYKDNYMKLAQDLVHVWNSICQRKQNEDDEVDIPIILQDIQCEHADLKSRASEIRTANECLKSQLLDVRNANEKLNATLEGISKVFNCDVSDSNRLIEHLDRQRNTEYDLKGKVENLTMKIDELNVEISSCKVEKEKLCIENDEIVHRLEEQRNECLRLGMEVVDLKRGISCIQENILNLVSTDEISSCNNINYSSLGNDDCTIVKLIKHLRNKIGQYNVEYDRVLKALQEKSEECHFVTEQYRDLENQLKEVRADAKGSGYMDIFVDKLSHEAVVEENKELKKCNEENRRKNREYMAEIRRLEHAVHNSTINNMLPNDNRLEITRLKDHVNYLEKELESRKSIENAYIKLKDEYSKIDSELETCLKDLKDRNIEYQRVLGESRCLEDKINELRLQLTNYKISEKSKEKMIEELKATIETLTKDKQNLQREYDEIDEEYDTCAKLLAEKEGDLKKLYTEKKILEARVVDLDLELKELRDDSQQQERKKKRQSILDINRGHLSNNSSAEINDHNASFERLVTDKRTAELEVENKSLQKTIGELTIKNKQLQDKLQKSSNATSHKSLSSNVENKMPVKLQEINRNIDQPVVGSGALLNQRLSEYMEENQRLSSINIKLKELCRTRDRKIAELEKYSKDNRTDVA